MADSPRAASGSVAPSLGSRLCRSLGIREGVDLEARFEPGPFPVLAVLDPDGTSRRFLLADAVEEGAGARHLVFLRILPLDLGAEGGGPAASLGRWRQEWSDIASLSRGGAVALRPAVGVQNLGAHAPILPPLYFCSAKKVMVAAVCQGHSGPVEEVGPAPADLCSLCGSPIADAKAAKAATALTPLEALWEQIRQRSDPAASAAPFEPHCVRCDNRETCYPAPGPSNEPTAAGGLLAPLTAGKPWGGVVVQPFHLPITAWERLVSGASWTGVKRELKALPAAILEEVETRLREDRRFLFSAESGEALGLEFHLLKLETLRQILLALSDLAIHRGHPHLDLRPETVWVRLEPGDSLRPALWSWRLAFLDLAPGFRSEGAGADGAIFAPPASRPAEFMPPGCGGGDEWIWGTCVLKSAGSYADQGLARIEFLPSPPFTEPPRKGDAVRVEIASQDPQQPLSLLPGRIDAVFPEMCRIIVHDPSRKGDALTATLARAQSGSGVRVKVIRDHSLVDDLFAAGTFWIASLLSAPGDVAAAARFREDLKPKLHGTRPGGGDTLVRESLRAAEASRLFSLGSPQGGADTGAAAKLGMVPLDPDLLARSLALGMRLCGAVPAGYPCQQHEPAGIEERARAYDTILSLLTELGRQVRERMLSTEAPADGLLPVLGSYALERVARGSARRPPRSSFAGGRPKGEA